MNPTGSSRKDNFTLTTLVKIWNRRMARDQQAILRYTNLIASPSSRVGNNQFSKADIRSYRSLRLYVNYIIAKQIESVHDH